MLVGAQLLHRTLLAPIERTTGIPLTVAGAYWICFLLLGLEKETFVA